MPLVKQIVTIPLGSNMIRSVAGEVLPPVAVESALNVSTRKDGSYERSAGERLVKSSTTFKQLFSAGNVLGVVDGYRVKARVGGTESTFSALNFSAPRVAVCDSHEIISDHDLIGNFDCTVLNDQIITAYNVLTNNSDISGPFLASFDTDFEPIIRPKQLSMHLSPLGVSSTAGLRVVPITTTSVAIVTASSTSTTAKLKAVIYSTGTKTVGSPVVLTALSSKQWDCASRVASVSGFLLALANGGKGRLKRYNALLVCLTTVDVTSTAVYGIGVDTTTHVTGGSRAIVATYTSAGTKARPVRFSIYQVPSLTSLVTGTAFVPANNAATGYGTCDRLVVGGGSTNASCLVAGSFRTTVSGQVFHYTDMDDIEQDGASERRGWTYHHVINTKPRGVGSSSEIKTCFFGLEYVPPWPVGGVAANQLYRQGLLCTITKYPAGYVTFKQPQVPVLGGGAVPSFGNGRTEAIIIPCAKYNTSIASGINLGTVNVPAIVTLSANSNKAFFASLVIRKLMVKGLQFDGHPVSADFTASTMPTGMWTNIGGRLVGIVTNTPISNQAALVNSVHLPYGILSEFDGQHLFEATPNYVPIVVQVPSASTAGTNDFRFKVTEELTDSAGLVHRTAPSFAVDADNLSSNADVIMTDLNFMPTAASPGIGKAYRPVVYRTIAGKTGLYYQCPGGGAGAVTPTYSAKECGGGLLRLNVSITTLYEKPLWSETGEAVPDMIPQFSDVIVAKNRMWGISAENPSEIWPSKLLVPELAPEWNRGLGLASADIPGGFVKLASVEDKIVAFSANGISYIYGDGPDNLGQNGTFAGPIPIPNSIGCLSKNSVVFGEFGALFQGQAGAYLLTPAMTITYVGAPVRELLGKSGSDATVTVVASCVDQQKREVHWYLSKTVTVPSSIVGETKKITGLVWNYELNTWTGRHYTKGSPSTLVLDAMTFSGTVYKIYDGVGLYKELSSLNATITHAGLSKDSVIETGWLHPSQFGGFNRCYSINFLARNYESGRSSVGEVRLDVFYNGTTSQYSESYVVSGLGTKPEELSIKFVPQIRKFESIKFQVSARNAANNSITASSYGWIRPYAITMEVGVRPGAFPYYNANQRK